MISSGSKSLSGTRRFFMHRSLRFTTPKKYFEIFWKSLENSLDFSSKIGDNVNMSIEECW